MLDEFLDDYFRELKKVNEFHWAYLVTHNFKFPKSDYIELKKFIDTATNFLSEIDRNIISKLTGKLYQDINSLHKYYNEFSKKSKYTEYVFSKEYLESIERYKKLKDEVDLAQKTMEDYNSIIKATEEQLKIMSDSDLSYKRMKKKYVDAIYELSKIKEDFYKAKKSMVEIEKAEQLKFFPEFNKLKSHNLKKLQKIINVKLYYFEKLLWFNASKSPAIIKFFDESQIEGDFSTKTFIKYFLKSIDVSKSSNSEWITYLQKMLRVVE